MASSPPPLPGATNLRAATGLNYFLPGAGFFLVGQPRTGALFAGAFLGCFVTVLALFLVGYARYMSLALNSDLLNEGELEKVGAAIPRAWIIGFVLVGVVIQVVSAIKFAALKKRMAAGTPAPV